MNEADPLRKMMTRSFASDMWNRQSLSVERETWTSRLGFLISCLGCAVGLGNIWRFPYLAYRYGTGSILIPYAVSMVFVGLPMFILELTLGQFSSSGPATCWDFCLFYEGCGLAMGFVSSMSAVYYNVMISWALFYLFGSFSPEIPWAVCGDWSTKFCRDRVVSIKADKCLNLSGILHDNGTCTVPNHPDDLWIWDSDLANLHGIRETLPAEEYFLRRVTKRAFGSISNLGPINYELLGCLALAWIVVFACLYNGMKTTEKITYYTVFTPFVVLTALLINGLRLDGAVDGLLHYLTLDFSSLYTAEIWIDAASQVFFSISISEGGLITLASYNDFHNNFVRDALIVIIVEGLTSLLASCVIFTYLGYLSKYLSLDISQVSRAGPMMAFSLYPFCLSQLPFPNLWSSIFFFMMLMMAVDSQFVLVDTVITCITDIFPEYKERKRKVLMIVCGVFFILGVPMVTNGGVALLMLVDVYGGGWNVLVIALCECVAVGWFYGADRFLKDLNVMIGGGGGKEIFEDWLAKYWKACWTVITPYFIVNLLAFSFLDYKPIPGFPWVANAAGWIIALTGPMLILAIAGYNFRRAPGTNVEKWICLTKPTLYWGPARAEHRLLVRRYAPDIALFNQDLDMFPMALVNDFDWDAIDERNKLLEELDQDTSVTEGWGFSDAGTGTGTKSFVDASNISGKSTADLEKTKSKTVKSGKVTRSRTDLDPQSSKETRGPSETQLMRGAKSRSSILLMKDTKSHSTIQITRGGKGRSEEELWKSGKDRTDVQKKTAAKDSNEVKLKRGGKGRSDAQVTIKVTDDSSLMNKANDLTKEQMRKGGKGQLMVPSAKEARALSIPTSPNEDETVGTGKQESKVDKSRSPPR